MRRSFTAIALAGSVFVHAQSFSTVYHNLNYLGGSGRSIFEVEDGYLLFSAQWSWDSTRAGLFTTKLDFAGTVLWEKQYLRAGSIGIGLIDPVAQSPLGGFTAVVGSRSSGSLDSLHLYHFDTNGDTISTHFVSADVSQGVRDCVGTPDGGYLIAGFCTLTADPVDDCACIRKVTDQGEELWRRTWPEYQYIHSIRPMSDGNYLLGAIRANSFDPTGLIKMDDAGNQQWIRFTGGSSFGGSAQALELPNGNYLVPSGWIPADSSGAELNWFATVYCFSPTGDQLWRRTMHYGLEAIASLACMMDDNELFVLGSYEQTPRDPDIATTLWRMNLDGDTLYKRKYWYYGGYAAVNVATYGINRTSDGGLIMTGAVRQPINGEQPLLYSTWILKLDQYGCLTPGCQNVGVADYEMALQSALVLAPNPASDRLNVTLPLPAGYAVQGAVQVVLLDAQGKEVLQKSFASAATELRTTLALEGLSPGMYYLHLRDELKWLAGGKVVVE